MILYFRSNDSFPVKTGSWPTGMVGPSFDAEYPSCPKIVLSESHTCKILTSGFISRNRLETGS